MARTVEGSAAAPGGNPAQFAVVLGLESQLAAQLSQARSLSLDPSQATPIGPGCARCHRSDCQQRSLPPRGAALQFDERSRGLTPFAFAR
jgi:predicted transcriptional regulator